MDDVIVVGVDDSPRSELALRWAAREAVVTGRRLRLVHAYDWPTVYPPITDAIPMLDVEELEKTARALLDRAAAHVDAVAPGVTLETVATAGPAAVVLREASGAAALLVVGSHGRGAVARVLLGSVSTALAAQAACPVVVVRDTGTQAAPNAPVVVGVDGSTVSSTALEFAADVAARRGLRLEVVHCWNPVQEGAERPRAWLTDAVAGQRRRYPDLEIVGTLPEGRPADVLVGYSEQASVLVVGSHGHGTLGGLLLGSVSQGVLHHASCPVAVVRTPARE